MIEITFKSHEEALKALAAADANPTPKRYLLRITAGASPCSYFMWHVSSGFFTTAWTQARPLTLSGAIARAIKMSSVPVEDVVDGIPIRIEQVAIIEAEAVGL